MLQERLNAPRAGFPGLRTTRVCGGGRKGGGLHNPGARRCCRDKPDQGRDQPQARCQPRTRQRPDCIAPSPAVSDGRFCRLGGRELWPGARRLREAFLLTPPEFRCPRFHLKFHERRFVLPARLFLCIFLPPFEGAGDPPGHLGDGAGHAAARGARCQSDYVRHDASAPGQVRVAGLLRGPGRRNVRPRPMPVKPHRCQQRVPVATAKGDVRRNAPVARFRDAARQQVAHAADPAGPGSCGIL